MKTVYPLQTKFAGGIITLIELAPSPYFFVLSICLAYMNMFARFDEIPAMTLRVIKETKRYGRKDNVKTVYPLQTKFAGGITRGHYFCPFHHYISDTLVVGSLVN